MHSTQNPAALDGITPSDLLRGAATYLTRYGWHQGQFFASSDPFPAASADGALLMAVYGRPVDVFDPANVTLFDEPDYDLWIGALDAVEDHLGLRRGFVPAQHIIAPGDLLFAWQDDPNRTRDQVVTALHEAADDFDRQQAAIRDAEALADTDPSDWTDQQHADWLGDSEPVIEPGYGCATCGPDEYCPDDAMARYWDNYDPDTDDMQAVQSGGAV
jgi:hypothetical protein